jgi:hypothetical protein
VAKVDKRFLPAALRFIALHTHMQLMANEIAHSQYTVLQSQNIALPYHIKRAIAESLIIEYTNSGENFVNTYG